MDLLAKLKALIPKHQKLIDETKFFSRPMTMTPQPSFKPANGSSSLSLQEAKLQELIGRARERLA
jgi:hypothetical protein